MEEKLKFREMLQDILALARVNQNKMDREVVEEYFEELNLKQEQMVLIYNYLKEQKVVISGEEAGETELEQQNMPEKREQVPEEEQALSIYLDELLELEDIGAEEEQKLMERAVAGEEEAKKRLTQFYLKTVPELAEPYKGKGMLFSDLIQEGNVALLLCMEQLCTASSPEEGTAMLRAGMQEAFRSAVSVQDFKEQETKNVVDKINYIKEAAENLAEELQRRPEVSDVAEYLEMKEEEVAAVLSLAKEELPVEKLH